MLAMPICKAQIVYVKSGATGNGSSWINATGNLKNALATATAGTQVWIAEGTYLPTTCTNCSNLDRQVYFEIPDGVEVYGGFAGTETMLSQRDWDAYPTILSGNIDQTNSNDFNSYTVLYTEEVSDATIVDGLVITEGKADSVMLGYGNIYNSGAGWFNRADNRTTPSNPVVRNCIFKDNFASGYGGGVLNDGYNGVCNPTFENCLFSNNIGLAGGGGMMNRGDDGGQSNVTISNCIFMGNSSDFDGGGMFNHGDNGEASPVITDCLFDSNTAAAHGGAVQNFGREGISNPTIDNCTFQNNTANIGGALHNNGSFSGESKPNITNSYFTMNTAMSAGAGLYNIGDEGGYSEPYVYNCDFIIIILLGLAQVFLIMVSMVNAIPLILIVLSLIISLTFMVQVFIILEKLACVCLQLLIVSLHIIKDHQLVEFII